MKDLHAHLNLQSILDRLMETGQNTKYTKSVADDDLQAFTCLVNVFVLCLCLFVLCLFVLISNISDAQIIKLYS